jgi:hypothetical protein
MPHMIALNDLARHHAPLRQELEAAMARVHDRGWYILGPEVEAFEREFAAYLGVAECIAVGNGTDALELALRVLMVGTDDTVATVANAGMYATTAIRAVGAVSAYVEIDPDDAPDGCRRLCAGCGDEAACDRRDASLRPFRRRRHHRPHRARASHSVDRGLRAGARREAGRPLARGRSARSAASASIRPRTWGHWATPAPSSPTITSSRRSCARCGSMAGVPSTTAR